MVADPAANMEGGLKYGPEGSEREAMRTSGDVPQVWTWLRRSPSPAPGWPRLPPRASTRAAVMESFLSTCSFLLASKHTFIFSSYKSTHRRGCLLPSTHSLVLPDVFTWASNPAELLLGAHHRSPKGPLL